MQEQHENNRPSRRYFLKTAGAGAAAIAGFSAFSPSCNPASISSAEYEKFFGQGDTILFQGDSITDAHRDRKNGQFNHPAALGDGYAMLTASELLGKLPGKALTIYNRGISGNKVYQLDERWQQDCIDLEPDVLSILIGVNDYWHMRQGRYDGTAGTYAKDFRSLLKRTRAALPDVRLVICQPFILTETSAVDASWVEPFRAYQESAATIAAEFGATWVPFQEAFDNALSLAPATYWAADGVHPSMAGAQLMANTWLNALK
ncbi:MAG: SGNH/GDSL hydrolase family protein [Bacteroidales bacterium]|nr:SGNH/GDSL hydrolase family protein [Bacteroidales bacterium]MDT8430440.1 SGNH/GDSL hydrolase family protein [Bacteroidales bacterium]